MRSHHQRLFFMDNTLGLSYTTDNFNELKEWIATANGKSSVEILDRRVPST